MQNDAKNALGEVLATDDGSLSLVHPGHGEAYHSRLGASAEARLLYIESSGIRAHFAVGAAARVLDVGLGLAYNARETIQAWADAERPGALFVQSLEIDPALVDALRTGDASWQANWSDAQRAWCRALAPETGRAGAVTAVIPHPRASATACRWTIHVGDAAAAALAGPFDFVWQDPFSPDKNPAMWAPAWFAALGAASTATTELRTYSVARRVRDALEAAGWTATRFPAAPGHKKQWLRAHLSARSARSSPAASPG